MYRLEDLNLVQQEAVRHKDGPLLILAGAGSGKTRVLTYRIAHLIAQGIEPWEILAITFTNKAAQEMRERVGFLVGSEGRGLWISTFHSACVRILRREIDNLPGYTRDFVIYDSSDQQTIIKTCLKECNLDEKKFQVRAVGAVISDAKNKLLDCDNFEQQAADYFQRQIAKVYRAYQKRLKNSNALDFDDLIMLAVLVFRQNPEILGRYQKRFHYILIDEYQDTNYAQYSLVKLLASQYRNLCVVGDDDQSVYGWRGADVKNILDFERDYPEAKVLKLEQNYRSTQTILEAANCVVSNNEKRKEKLLWTKNPKGQPLVFYVADDERDEAKYVTERIQFLHNSGRPYNDFAVLYRTNAQSRVLEERLMKEGIPYRIFSGHKFYERMEIKDVLAYLRLLSNPADKVNFARILNVPKRGLGGTSLARVMEYAEEQNMPVLEVVSEADYIPDLRPKARKSVLAFALLMQGLKEFADKEMSVTTIVEEILDRTGYRNLLIADDSPESQARLENLAEFLSVASEYDLKAQSRQDEDEFGMGFIPGLSGFLEHVALVAETDQIDQQEAAVVLMTMHSVKGLEFPVVFIVGMEEGIFPGTRSQLEPELIEEERRLCYVALTRAREKVYLCYAGQRMLYGRRQYNLRSRFLEEIPYNLLEEKDPSGEPPGRQYRKPKFMELRSRVSAPGVHVSAFGSPARKLGTPLVENAQEEFLVGEKILHDKFGQGIIMGVTGKGRQVVLTINFQGQLKQIATEYVNLTKLKTKESD
ncbi:MAG: DNA helicase PcrA [Desulfitobacteriaceae bacterium]|nr:DNA helicase PcrA [Desulfitobacteriaceae bacterium]MDD4346686.1 DNA helicase PcrA [Desulfitobacteriaceae bacterium]MDD4401147.1 DNA helicase PcrA [Desulfitobacteriaceae bacterium]